MALTFVQASAEAIANPGTSVAQSYATGTTLGSLLIAHTLFTGPFTVTDTLGNTWTAIGGSTNPGVFFAVNAGSGANTVTLHTGTSATLTIGLAEYTGQKAGANPIDTLFSTGEVAFSEVGTGTVNFGSLTTAFTNVGLIFFGRSSPGGIATLTPQDGSTSREASNASLMLMDRNVVAAGTYSCAFSTSFSGDTGTGIYFSVKTPTSVATTSPAAWVNRHRKFINKR